MPPTNKSQKLTKNNSLILPRLARTSQLPAQAFSASSTAKLSKAGTTGINWHCWCRLGRCQRQSFYHGSGSVGQRRELKFRRMKLQTRAFGAKNVTPRYFSSHYYAVLS